MTGRRNIIVAVSAIVVFAAIVGFFITLDVSPQIAYARLFIDAGLIIGLVAVILAFYRERELATGPISQCVRNLKAGEYKARITCDLGPLAEIGKDINELALVLEDCQYRQQELKRSLREELLPSLKAREGAISQNLAPIEHSFHPELGPVHTLSAEELEKPVKKQGPSSFYDVTPVPMAKKPQEGNERRLSNTLIASNPPKPEPEALPFLPNLDIKEQDLTELYQRFINAQKDFNIDQIEYTLFLNTIEKTKKELMSSYQCHSILFDIVKEANQVALQPKIIRTGR